MWNQVSVMKWMLLLRLWTLPLGVTHTQQGPHRIQLRETAPSIHLEPRNEQKAAGSQRTRLPSLQILPCPPAITRPWLVFPHQPWLQSTARQQLDRTDELTRQGVPTSFYLQGLAGEALLNSAGKGHLYHEETRAHQPRQKTLPSTGCHASMDIKPNISKTSLPLLLCMVQ